MTKTTFLVKTRNLEERAHKLRGEGWLPANIFGANKESQAIQAKLVNFEKELRNAGESSLIYLQLDDQKEQLPVLIEELQKDPVTNKPIHVSFKQVSLKERIEAEVPIEIAGEFELPEAVLVTVRDAVEVKALPTNLPEKIVVDVSGLSAVGQSITLADLDYDRERVELVVGEEGEEAPVVLVQEVKEEPEPELESTEELAEGEEVREEAGSEVNKVDEEEVREEEQTASSKKPNSRK